MSFKHRRNRLASIPIAQRRRLEKLNKDSTISVIEVTSDGSTEYRNLKISDLINLFSSIEPEEESNFKTAASCYRDLMIFLQHVKFPSNDESVLLPDLSTSENSPKLPAILPRSGMGFFLIDLFKLKIACWADRCLVLDYTEKEFFYSTWRKASKASTISSSIFIENFIRGLQRSLLNQMTSLVQCQDNSTSSWQRELISELSKSRIKSHLSQMFVPFEMIVLDNALRVTSTRFQHYFAKMKPIINRLLSSVSTDPCEKTLEKILAFKKSLLSFEMSVVSTKKAIQIVLANDFDMADLYLSEVRHVDHHDEVELLLEGYRADFLQIQLEVGTIKGQIDDAKEFINTHQNETRNQIVKLNLYMEMFGLGVASSSCLSSFFGMNMITGLEDHPFAFFLAACTISLICGLLVVSCIFRFRGITQSGKTHQYPLLKNLVRYIDTLETLKKQNDKSGNSDFADVINKLIGQEVHQDEIDLLFPVSENELKHLSDPTIDQIRSIVESQDF